MSRHSTGLILGAAAGLVVALASCQQTDTPVVARTPVPEEFREACGRPGAQVELPPEALPVDVAREDCDLSGVRVRIRGGAGVEVNYEPGLGVTGTGDTSSDDPSHPSSFTAEVSEDGGTVTFS